jgi:protein required for attachment to host cells
MDAPNEVWALLADGRRGRLLRCTEGDNGRVHIEERGAIANTWPGHEHQRSSPLWKNATITFGIEDTSREQLHRFARQVAAWLADRMEAFGIRHVDVLASGRFLGALRKVRPARLACRCALDRNASLMHLSPGRLARHPAIRRLMASVRS